MPASQTLFATLSDVPATASDVDAVQGLQPETTDSVLANSYNALAVVLEHTEQQHHRLLQVHCEGDRIRLRYKGIGEVSESIVGADSQLAPAIDDVYSRAQDVATNKGTLVLDTHTALRFSVRAAEHYSGVILEFKHLPTEQSLLVLDQCNLLTAQLQQFRQWLKAPSGLVAIAGPNEAALEILSLAVAQDLCSINKTITRVANDISVQLPRILQCDRTNRDRVSALLELHNDVIVIDQIDSGPIEFNHLPITNTLLVQTVQADSAGAALTCLLSNGYSTEKLAHNLVGLLICHSYQQLCGSCKCIADLSSEERQWLNQFRTPVSENVMAWLDDGAAHQYLHSEGCADCDHTGIAGTGSVYELVQLEEEELQTLAQGNSMRVVHQLEQRHNSADALLNEAKKGLVSISEIRNRLSGIGQTL